MTRFKMGYWRLIRVDDVLGSIQHLEEFSIVSWL
jgi:hypothetical protein